MMLIGSVKARKIGKRRNKGVVRSGRKWRKRRRTNIEMMKTDNVENVMDVVAPAMVAADESALMDLTSTF